LAGNVALLKDLISGIGNVLAAYDTITALFNKEKIGLIIR